MASTTSSTTNDPMLGSAFHSQDGNSGPSSNPLPELRTISSGLDIEVPVLCFDEIDDVQFVAADSIVEELNSVSTSMQQTGVRPDNTAYEGVFNFKLHLHAPNTKDFLFSEKLDKVFVKPDSSIPVAFNLNFGSTYKWLEDLKIRALVMFVNEARKTDPVKVCAVHKAQTTDGAGDHILRCQNPRATYEEDPVSKRCSILVPVERPQAGSSNAVMQTYRCLCTHSCPGGISRTDIEIVFTLEYRGEVYGRCTLPIRVCASPKRDMKAAEEKKPAAEGKKPMSVTKSNSKKRKLVKEETSTSDNDEDVYKLKISGKEKYKMLKKLYDMMA